MQSVLYQCQMYQVLRLLGKLRVLIRDTRHSTDWDNESTSQGRQMASRYEAINYTASLPKRFFLSHH